MNVLIVGGTGLIGGTTALLLKEQGHTVTLMARKPSDVDALKAFAFIEADYSENNITAETFAPFDTLIFTAAVDPRNLPQDGSVSASEFYHQKNTIAVPRFIQSAIKAGVDRCVYVGSFYPQVAPERVATDDYVKSRDATDKAIRQLSDTNVSCCSVNAPFVIGAIDGLQIPHLEALVHYVRGHIQGLPLFAPLGGSNFVSAKLVAQAIYGAMQYGKAEQAYLVGDQNLSWQEYLNLWASLANSRQSFETSDADHPMFPNSIMFAGPGASISYEVNQTQKALLAYQQTGIEDTIREIISATDARNS